MQDTMEREEQIQQVTKQNTKLMTLVQDQQKKFEEIMKHSEELMEAMTEKNQERKANGGPTRRTRDKKRWCSHCKEMETHSSHNCYSLEANKDKRPPWYFAHIKNKGKQPTKSG